MWTGAGAAEVELADFESFYLRSGRSMLVLAFSLTGSWSDAEDLVQEAFVAAHRRWDVVGRYDDPAGWVRRVITNAAVSRWRRLSRELRVRERLASRAAIPPSEADAVDARFWAAVQDLPRQQRVVTVLHYVEDLSVDSIASIVGCTSGTVKTQLFRARRTLAVRLGAPFEEQSDG